MKQILLDFNINSITIGGLVSHGCVKATCKPTIDILLQVSKQIDVQRLENVFKTFGYQLTKKHDNPPPHMTFVKGYTIQGFSGQAYHVHIRYKGDWDEIRFRDYLIKHAEIAKEYEALKLELAGKYKNDREKYTDLKADFIEKIKFYITLLAVVLIAVCECGRVVF